MGSYVNSSLGRGELLVKMVDKSVGELVKSWLLGILFFWLLLIPLIKAIMATIEYNSLELALTNKRLIGKTGVVRRNTLDVPLNKVQNISVKTGFWGRIFRVAVIEVSTAGGDPLYFKGIKDADKFKNLVMSQIEQYEEERVREQATLMANAMKSANI